MKRGTKEFYNIHASFEQSIKKGFFPGIPVELEKEKTNPTKFYSNEIVNNAFLVFLHGYAAAESVYR